MSAASIISVCIAYGVVVESEIGKGRAAAAAAVGKVREGRGEKVQRGGGRRSNRRHKSGRKSRRGTDKGRIGRVLVGEGCAVSTAAAAAERAAKAPRPLALTGSHAPRIAPAVSGVHLGVLSRG